MPQWSSYFLVRWFVVALFWSHVCFLATGCSYVQTMKLITNSTNRRISRMHFASCGTFTYCDASLPDASLLQFQDPRGKTSDLIGRNAEHPHLPAHIRKLHVRFYRDQRRLIPSSPYRMKLMEQVLIAYSSDD